MPAPPAPSARTDQGGPMTATRTVPEGGFRFVPGVYQYSAGVAAEPGFALERVRFAEPVPLTRGFARVAELLEAAGRPKAAFAACELRSPAPFTEEGFAAFNRAYGGVLAGGGPFPQGGVGPVPRGRAEPGGPQQRLPGGRAPARALLPRLRLHGAGPRGPALLRRRRQRRGAGGRGQLPRPRRRARRPLARRAPRQGPLGAGRDGTADGPARRRLGGHHRGAGLHGARHPFPPRRGAGRARRRPARPDVAVLPPAGGRPGQRDGLPRRLARAGAARRLSAPRRPGR